MRMKLALALALVAAVPAVAAPWREVLREGFDAAALDPHRWTIVPDKLTVPTWDDHAGGKAIHFRSEMGDRGLATVTRPAPPYRLTFDLLQPAAEAGGYRLVVQHPCRDGVRWWFEVGSSDFAVWTTHLGGWAPRWTGDNLRLDTWYRVVIETEPERTRVTITDAAGEAVAASDWLPHDDLGDPGGLRFTAASGGGLRGVVFDDIILETVGGVGGYRTAAPVDKPLHEALAGAGLSRRDERLVLRTRDGLRLDLDGDAAARRLDLGGANLLPAAPTPGGFYVWDAAQPAKYERFVGRVSLGDGGLCDLRCEPLKLRLQARFRATDSALNVEGELRDTSGQDRALVLVWVLPLEAGGWTWGDSLLAGRPVREVGRYHANQAYGLAGAAGRHLVAPFPWVSLGKVGQGLMVARPLDCPRLMGWWYDYTPAARFLAVRVELGLSTATTKFPSRATFRFALSPLPRPEWGMRAAAQRYYDLYPGSFTRRVKAGQEGLWTPWVTTEVPQPEDFALVFHEQEPYSEDRILFDEAHGGLSFTYSEPNALWQRCDAWDATKHLLADVFLAKVRERAQQPPTATTDYPLSTQPKPLPDPELARAYLNSYIGRDDQLTSTWPSPPDRLCTNMNSDPELPRPNRASLWFDYEGVPALTDSRVDGAYIDSIAWCSFDSAENFRREHWATADLPLVPSFQSGGVAQLAGFAHYELYQAIAEAMRSRGKLVSANTFPYTHVFVAHLLDVIGAGEGGDLESFHDATRLSFSRALAYRKPVSHMNYAYFNPDVPVEQKERALQRNLIYDVWPGSGNVAKPEQIEPLRPLFRRYMPLFAALARAGWQPITEARVTPASVLLERYGDPASGSVYLVIHNPSDESVSASVRLEGPLAKGTWEAQTKDEVTGEPIALTKQGFSVTLKPWQTVMVALKPPG